MKIKFLLPDGQSVNTPYQFDNFKDKKPLAAISDSRAFNIMTPLQKILMN